MVSSLDFLPPICPNYSLIMHLPPPFIETWTYIHCSNGLVRGLPLQYDLSRYLRPPRLSPLPKNNFSIKPARQMKIVIYNHRRGVTVIISANVSPNLAFIGDIMTIRSPHFDRKFFPKEHFSVLRVIGWLVVAHATSRRQEHGKHIVSVSLLFTACLPTYLPTSGTQTEAT